MRITFILQGWITIPVGGLKIIYEYANRLVERGHNVTVLHPLDFESRYARFRQELVRARRCIGTLVRGRWFDFHHAVNFRVTPTLAEEYVPDADAVIATCWPTAVKVKDYSPQKGEKYYFIQLYETWIEDRRHIDLTWKFSMQKIVVAKWLKAVAEEMKESAVWVPNAIDFRKFSVQVPIDQRNVHSLGMLYHRTDWKGFDDGVSAASIVAKKYPDISLTIFGAYPRPKNLPPWITYIKRPSERSLAELYNSTSIFIHTSWIEGWGLTPAEAMACGCAVVATNSRGILDYAEHEKNALISPPRSPQRLAENIITLIEDNAKRIRLARAGYDRIKQFTWDSSVDRFEQALSKNIRN